MMSIGWAIARWRRARPRSLLDNTPLERLLERADQHRAAAPGDARRPPARRSPSPRRATARACTSPSTTRSATSCRGRARSASPCAAEITCRTCSRRRRSRSSFPRSRSTSTASHEYCGDGSMRQAAPISPAVHLGAERILVVGAGRMHEPPGERAGSSEYPNLAQIAGHALSNIFLDALAVDVERLQRINATLALLPPRGARRDQPEADRGAGDRAERAARRHRRASTWRACRCRSGRCCAAWASRAAATTRAAPRWPATCSSRRPTRAS